MVRRRDAADEPGSNILYTLKFCQIFVGEYIEKRIARVKPRRDKSMNQTSGSVIIKVLTNFTYLPDGHKSCFTNNFYGQYVFSYSGNSKCSGAPGGGGGGGGGGGKSSYVWIAEGLFYDLSYGTKTLKIFYAWVSTGYCGKKKKKKKKKKADEN